MRDRSLLWLPSLAVLFAPLVSNVGAHGSENQRLGHSKGSVHHRHRTPKEPANRRSRRLVASVVPSAVENAKDAQLNAATNDTAAHHLPANDGRYGHSAVYIPSQEKVLFLAGQLAQAGLYITNDVLALSTTSAYPSATNPDEADLSTGLPPHAWAATAVDDAERVWMIGGVTQDCGTNAVAYVLDHTSKWQPVSVKPRAPPRRRQAQAVPFYNSTSGQTDLLVFGGIAEQYTCSLDTVGYMGIDRWRTNQADTSARITTTAWDSRRADAGSFAPPVSDYAAAIVKDSFLVLGGQTAAGELVELDRVLRFDLASERWSVKVRPVPETAQPSGPPRVD